MKGTAVTIDIQRRGVLLGSLGAAAQIVSPGLARAAELETIRIGLHPVLDYQPWAMAKEMGLDKEQGLSFEIVSVASQANGAAALRQGAIDIASGSEVGTFAYYKAIPNMRTWIVLNRFKGFILVGRKGAVETYASLAPRVGPEAARLQILKSMKGKSFAINPVSYLALVKACLGQVGMTMSDVKLFEFPDDAKAALAFEKGVGDFYMGSLPQEIKLLGEPDLYVNVGGAEILGPAGLWYSAMMGMEPWLKDHRETVLKLHAIWYRTSRYLNERQSQILPLWASNINSRAAASFTKDDIIKMSKFLEYPSIEQAKTQIFNDKSDLGWRKAMSFYGPQNTDRLPGDFSTGKYQLEQEYFEAFLARPDLVSWVNAPLK
jgi:ABC-type nitrate/sulfonate/bicarbonate transport system substrate-binding protein